jgi:pimeloyl-ACP methyl ester carboxylesterase
MPERTVNGLRYYFEDAGTGTPVVLLHGFPDTSALWRSQIAALSAAGYRAIAPDLRGRGHTERPERAEDYALSKVTQDIAALLDSLEIRRAHIVGHDWGAGVAWVFAALLPDRVDHLVAISVPHPRTGGRPTLEALQKGWYRLLFQFEGVAEELARQDDWYLMRVLLQGQGDFDRYVEDLSQPGALTAALNWYRANLPPQRLLGQPTLPPVSVPTLGVFGARDQYLTEDAMRRSGEFVTGPWRYERFDAAGHWVSLDEPDRLNRLLLEFLGPS